MTGTLKQLGRTGLLLTGFLLVAPAPGGASHESFVVYEDWTTSETLRSDRWTVQEGGPAQDGALEIKGHQLVMRQRREGTTTSNAGSTGAVQGILARNPSAIDQMEADFKVRNMTVSGCAVNPGLTMVRPALLSFSAFNDGSPGGQTGDHSIGVQVNGPADSVDPSGVMTVQGYVVRCSNPTCSIGSSSIFNLAVATVLVSEPFTLRAIWDRPNNRFLVGVNSNPDVVLAYDPALDSANARVPVASVRAAMLAANCTAGPAVADAEIAIQEVRTNLSAIIP